jgi:hypothetical protein
VIKVNPSLDQLYQTLIILILDQITAALHATNSPPIAAPSTTATHVFGLS